MKAQINVQPNYSLSKVVSRLVLVGGVLLGAVYLLLEALASLVKAIG